jgi:HlyD family secretion protein
MATTKKRSGRKVVIFTILLLLLAGLGTAAALKGRQPILMVQTEKVGRRNLTEVVNANGKLQPVLQVKISPEVSGEIIELPVKEGQPVKKGDLLVRIKRDFYEASRNSAEASFKSAQAGERSAQANLLTAEITGRKADAEFKRNADLYEKKLLSDSVYDDVRSAAENAASQVKAARAQSEASLHQVEMAQAALKKAEEDLLKTTIYSPIDGTVSKLNSEAGERVVGTGMMAGTEIMTIADLNEMEARVEVGEVDVVLVKLGQKASLEVDSFKDRKFAGLVTQIANSAKNNMSGGGGGGGMGSSPSADATKFEVRIRLQDKEPFRPGMSVTADIETQYRTNVLAVPIQSVTTRLPKDAKDEKKGSGIKDTEEMKAEADFKESQRRKGRDIVKPIDVVFGIDNGKAKMIPVKRGISDDTHYEITEGAAEGQEVVTGSFKALARELEDGKALKVDNKPKTRKPGENKDKNS